MLEVSQVIYWGVGHLLNAVGLLDVCGVVCIVWCESVRCVWYVVQYRSVRCVVCCVLQVC